MPTHTHTHTPTLARAHTYTEMNYCFHRTQLGKKTFLSNFHCTRALNDHINTIFSSEIYQFLNSRICKMGTRKNVDGIFFFLHFFGLTANERHTVGKKIHFTVCSRLASQQKTNSQLNIDIVGALVSLCGPWVRAHHSNSFPLTTCRLIHVVYQHIDTHSLACRYMSHSAARVVQSGRWIHVCYFTLQKNGLRCVNVYWHRSYSRVDGIACVRKREGEYVRMLELCWHLAAYIDSDPSADTKHHFRFL